MKSTQAFFPKEAARRIEKLSLSLAAKSAQFTEKERKMEYKYQSAVSRTTDVQPPLFGVSEVS